MYSVVGDPHAIPANADLINLLFDILEDLGNDVIILGDLFDTKEIIRGKIFNLVRRRIKKSKLKFYFLIGNHDWFNSVECLEHSLESFKDLPNAIVVDQPLKMNMDSRSALLLPYYDDMDKLREILKEAKVSGTDYVFMHQGVVGFDYGNGYIADGNGHGEMKADDLTGFLRIISGHFHKFAEEGNFMFLGTPFSHSWGETDQKKYIALFEPNENTLELLETPFPNHRTMVLDLSKTPEQLKKSLDKLKSKDFWRVQLVGTEAQIRSFDQGPYSEVKFLEEPTDSEQVENTTLKDTDSNEQKFLTWAKEYKGLDEKTIQLGLEIMGESK